MQPYHPDFVNNLYKINVQCATNNAAMLCAKFQISLRGRIETDEGKLANGQILYHDGEVWQVTSSEPAIIPYYKPDEFFPHICYNNVTKTTKRKLHFK